MAEVAIQAVEELGGEVSTVHYNRLALRALLKPHKFSNPKDDNNDNENHNHNPPRQPNLLLVAPNNTLR